VSDIRPSDEDNAITALEHPDRVYHVRLSVTGSQLGKMSAVIQEPFPVLTHLSISTKCRNELVLPSGFLGGFAPCLQELELGGIAFPSLPTLLLSASNLVELNLCNVPETGYISPDALVTHLAALPRLKFLKIGFNSYSDPIPLRPIIRSVLPSLQSLLFTGDCQYLEDFVPRIDTPQLNSIVIYYWDQDIDFVVPQLSSFITRSESLKKILSGHCQITVDIDQVVDFHVGGSPREETERWDRQTGVSLCILCTGVGARVDGQISHLANILGWLNPILSDVVHFTLDSMWVISESKRMSEAEDLDDLIWLRLLHRFSSVKTLFVPNTIAGLISQALEYVDEEMVTIVLPALELFCLEKDEGEGEEEEKEQDQRMSSVHKFINLRRAHDGRSVTFVGSKDEFEVRLKSYY
jgi:hypothetical protein